MNLKDCCGRKYNEKLKAIPFLILIVVISKTILNIRQIPKM